jgi:hypothetical protein
MLEIRESMFSGLSGRSTTAALAISPVATQVAAVQIDAGVLCYGMKRNSAPAALGHFARNSSEWPGW